MNSKASFGNRFRSKLRGIKPMLMQDNSISKFQRTLFLKLGSHYPPLCGIVQLTNSAALRPACAGFHFRNWSFTIKFSVRSYRLAFGHPVSSTGQAFEQPCKICNYLRVL
jgi:hypothetical protein